MTLVSECKFLLFFFSFLTISETASDGRREGKRNATTPNVSLRTMMYI